jgi:hypothetical protein
MLNKTRLGLMVAVSLNMMLVLAGCGGVGSAPINGIGSLARVAVSVSPPTMTVTTGTTEPFTAAVSNTGETGVGWLVNGLPGGINPNDGSSPFGTIDKNGNYTAPPFIPIPPNVTVTAVANADNNATANASVSINGTPSPVSISPLSANLEVGRTVGGVQQLGGIVLFTATVNNSNPAVNWLVENVPGGNANVGTISLVPGSLNQVTYAAPQSLPGGGPQVHVTAQSVADPQETASAVVTLLPAGSTVVTITSPTLPPTLQVGQLQTFEASVTGSTDATVSWEVDGIAGGNSNVGTITSGPNDTGLYTAPTQLPNPSQVIVTATSDAQPAAQASIPVNLIALEKVTVAISAEGCINTNGVLVNTAVQLTALVTGVSSQSVDWQVNKIAGGNSTIGTITSGGLYTAPAKPPNPATVVISAVSVDDPLAIGNQPLTLVQTPLTKITISPSSPQVAQAGGQGLPFTATVLGLVNPAVTWYVNGLQNGDQGSVGGITPVQGGMVGCSTQVLYDPPPTVPAPPLPNPVPVTAAAIDDTKSAPVMVTITAGAQYTMSLDPSGEVFVMVGQTQPYCATDSDPNDSVTWSVSGASCTGIACGTIVPGVPNGQCSTLPAIYTAPANAPSPVPTVTVTVSSVKHAGLNATDEVFIQGVANPSISITPSSQSVAAGDNDIPFQATIQNYDPTATVEWELGCISDWNGEPGEDCNDNDRHDGDGPGCIEVPNGKQHCGDSQPLDAPGNIPLTYISPKLLFTNDFNPNQCSGQSNDGNGYLYLKVTLEASGCPQGTCTAFACVKVTP